MIKTSNISRFTIGLSFLLASTMLTSCTDKLPSKVNTNFSTPTSADDKFPAVTRYKKAPITYVKLDKDVLRPMKQLQSRLPSNENVGPFEMREETLAGALELILGGKKIPMAFETNKATTNTVTISNLQGKLNDVVDKVCSLANLYCSYENGTMIIKETESFTVSLPPMIADDYTPFVSGLAAITGGQTYVDSLTRSLTYTTTQRNHQRAIEYFDRLRSNTAMIVYEIQIWEVQLSDRYQTGIDWEALNGGLGAFDFNLSRDGTPAITGGLGIGTQFTSTDLTADVVLTFLQTQGAVKTISQPQLTVLSGSEAKLRVGNSRDYVSQITRTVGVNTADNVSVSTSKLETGLNLGINSAWDNSTVYGNLKIEVQNLIRLGSLDVGTTSIQLPETSDRSIETKLRVRPGDAVLIGGIVEQRNTLDQSGLPGNNKPIFAIGKDKLGSNTELVFMLRPRVVIYTENPPTQAQLRESQMVVEPERIEQEAEILPRGTDEAMPVVMEDKISNEPLPLVKKEVAPVMKAPAKAPVKAPAKAVAQKPAPKAAPVKTIVKETTVKETTVKEVVQPAPTQPAPQPKPAPVQPAPSTPIPATPASTTGVDDHIPPAPADEMAP
jgi:hypothetical protein